MNNLLILGGPGTPGMTQVIEIVVLMLGILIILNSIYEFFRRKLWKKLLHRHKDIFPPEPTNHIPPAI